MIVNITELKVMEHMANPVDRISVLPSFIIHHIMSYLSTNEVARTSILSKRWNQLRTSFPILDFDQNQFASRTLCYRNFCVRRKNKKFCEGVKRFMNFVDASLHQFCKLKLSIQKFRLFISLLDVKESSSDVDKWIGLAVENGVKELDFEVITDEDTVYVWPQTIFSAKLLTTLKLVGCRLEQPSDTIRFHSLKKLTLERVCLNEQMVQKLTSECLVLEDLCFSCCWGLKHLSVSKALNLKIMKIHSPSNEPAIVEIDVPSLQQLTLQFSRMGRPPIVDIARSPHLKKFELYFVSFTDQEFNNFISKLPMLEELFVWSCYSLERIVISCKQLRSLNFSNCECLKAIEADTPNLLSFTYDNNPIPDILLNASCPWVVSIDSEGVLDTRWFLKAKKFLSVSNQIEKLSLAMKSDKVCV